LIMQGVVSGGASAGLIKDGAGEMDLVNANATANTYGGQTWVKDGTLGLNDNVSNAAVSMTVVVGDGAGAAGTAVLRLLQPHELPDDAAITVHGDGRFDLNGYAE